MQIEPIEYNSGLETEWDNFINFNKRNATFLHSRKFFDHNPLNKTDDQSLLFYKKNKLIAVLPAALYEKEGTKIFHSHPRSTYGGFVLHESAGVAEAMEIIQATIDFAAGKDVNEIIIRNPFRILHQLPSDETDYAMWHYGFTVKSRELECAVKLDDATEKRYENGAKYNIKKAHKSVDVKESDDYEKFWHLLTANLEKKHSVKPVHTVKQLLDLKEMVGADRIKLFGGYVNHKFVCGVLVFICNRKTLHAQYIASDDAFQEIRPLNAVIDHIIQWGKENNFEYFNLGTANEEAGTKINFGLFHFKEGFGARGILRETMHLIL